MEEQAEKRDPNRTDIQQEELPIALTSKQSVKIIKSIPDRQRREWTKRWMLNKRSSQTVVGKQNRGKKGRRAGSECLQLPKVGEYLMRKSRKDGVIGEVTCELIHSGLEENNGRVVQRESMLKKQGSNFNAILSLSRNLQTRMKPVVLRQNLSQRKQYIYRLKAIQMEGIEFEKSTNEILTKAKQVGNVIDKNYVRLRKNSNCIITGVQQYRLQEENSQVYKEEVMNMWLKCDR